MKRSRDYHNELPSAAPPAGVPRDQIKIDFAKRLQKAMIDKGWNQSELARRATAYLPKGHTIGRDNISHYVRGVALPRPAQLAAVAKSLGLSPAELMPTMPSATAKSPPFDMRQLENGSVWLRVNQPVTFDQALQIMKILQERKPNGA
jgi:transcriptional regulator with XRE-family HTH domain